MVLWNEEDQSDNECDDDDRETERVSREESDERDEEIIDRFIEKTRERGSDRSWLTQIECDTTIIQRSFCGDGILPWSLSKDMIEHRKWEELLLFRKDDDLLTKIRSRFCDIREGIGVDGDWYILTRIESQWSGWVIDHLDFWNIWDRDIFLIDLEDDPLSDEGILGVCLREEKILNGEWESEGVEENEEDTRIHREKEYERARC